MSKYTHTFFTQTSLMDLFTFQNSMLLSFNFSFILLFCSWFYISHFLSIYHPFSGRFSCFHTLSPKPTFLNLQSSLSAMNSECLQCNTYPWHFLSMLSINIYTPPQPYFVLFNNISRLLIQLFLEICMLSFLNLCIFILLIFSFMFLILDLK